MNGYQNAYQEVFVHPDGFDVLHNEAGVTFSEYLDLRLDL